MAWVESHQELRSHPKTKRLARMLDVHRMQAIGHLHALWWWALDHAEDGDVSSYEPDDLADACDWDGDPGQLVKALIECGPGESWGFLERLDGGELVLHNWWQYAGKLVEQRRHNATQKRKHRELYNDRALIAAVRRRDGSTCRYCGREVDWNDRRGGQGATYDYVDPDGPNTADNVVVACRGCNAGKSNRTPDQVGYTLVAVEHQQESTEDTQEPVEYPWDASGDSAHSTQPNLTEPNQTDSSSPPGGDDADASSVDPVEQSFEQFWDAYPRHRTSRKPGGGASRKKALDRWRRMKAGERELALSAVDNYRDWCERPDGEFPAHATTWLNEQRWDQWQEPASPSNVTNFNGSGQYPPGESIRDLDENGVGKGVM